MNSSAGNKGGQNSTKLDEKYDPNCPTCIDFKDWFKKQSQQQSVSSTGANKQTTNTSNNAIKQASTQEHSSGKEEKSSSSASYYDDCPLFRDQFGRVAWSYLHTMAAHYPQKPTEVQMTKMKDFIETFTMFFPCKHCADDFREEFVVSIYITCILINRNAKNPPRVENNVELSKWFCEQHNQVNIKLGKEEFDCDRVMERWRMGKSKNPNCL